MATTTQTNQRYPAATLIPLIALMLTLSLAKLAGLAAPHVKGAPMYEFDPIKTERAMLFYAKHRLAVFPTHVPLSKAECSCGDSNCKHIGKHPRTNNGFLGATTSPNTIQDWLKHKAPFNPAIATGAVSGAFVLDVDPDKGGQGSLADLEKEHGKLPKTWTANTGGGGNHFFFRHPGFKIKTFTNLRDGLDIRGDGGYVVAAPAVHKSGRRYEWATSLRPFQTELASAPQWLLDEIANHGSSGSSSSLAKPASYWREQFHLPLDEGERNDRITRFAGHLLSKRVDPYVALELLIAFNDARGNPGLSDDEVFRCVLSIVRREANQRVWG